MSPLLRKQSMSRASSQPDLHNDALSMCSTATVAPPPSPTYESLGEDEDIFQLELDFERLARQVTDYGVQKPLKSVLHDCDMYHIQ
eukprot:289491-Amorphochlora_amoeboformis.AAC.1